MKRNMFFLLVIVVLAAYWAYTGLEPKKGDTLTVRAHKWVEVKNQDGISNGNVTFGCCETCSIHEGGTLRVIEIQEDNILVIYSVSGAQYGASCPNGVVFVMPGGGFFNMKAEAFATSLFR